MNDLTHGINPNQSAKAMAIEYRKREAKADADAAAEAAEIPKSEMEPSREGERMVARGRLNPDNGQEIPLTDKARKVASWVPSQRFMDNYEQMRWDHMA